MFERYRRALLMQGMSVGSLDSEEDSQVVKPSKQRPALIQNLPFFPKWATERPASDESEPASSLVIAQRDARRSAEKVPGHAHYKLYTLYPKLQN